MCFAPPISFSNTGRGGAPMRDYIRKRVVDVSRYIVEARATVRQAAAVFGVSKSTVHKDVTERLPRVSRRSCPQGKADPGPEQGREAHPGRRGDPAEVPGAMRPAGRPERRERGNASRAAPRPETLPFSEKARTVGHPGKQAARMSSNTLPRPSGPHHGRFGPRGAAPVFGAISGSILVRPTCSFSCGARASSSANRRSSPSTSRPTRSWR